MQMCCHGDQLCHHDNLLVTMVTWSRSHDFIEVKAAVSKSAIFTQLENNLLHMLSYPAQICVYIWTCPIL
jgi:hypothetical protein